MEPLKEINSFSEKILNFDFQDNKEIPFYREGLIARNSLPIKGYNGIKINTKYKNFRQKLIFLKSRDYFFSLKFDNNILQTYKLFNLPLNEKYEKMLDKKYSIEALICPDNTVSASLLLEPVPHVKTLINYKFNQFISLVIFLLNL